MFMRYDKVIKYLIYLHIFFSYLSGCSDDLLNMDVLLWPSDSSPQ